MGATQRYVSDELTHFVGRRLDKDAQYRLLVHVLREGVLSPPPHVEGLDEGVRVAPDAPVSRNQAYVPQAVCFCDIPVGDLDLHIEKYSPFGLAFRKPFVVAAGASPVFYVAGASPTRGPGGERVPRARRYDEAIRAYQRVRLATQRALADKPAPETAEVYAAWLRAAEFFDRDVLSHLKFFEYPADDAARDNYYMEREWRLLGDMRFALADVRRVVVPEAYAARLREDVPAYAGQVTFARGA